MTPSFRHLAAALASLVALTLVTPAPASAAAEKKVVCKDGTKDEGGRGACSGHGGIDQAATDKADKAAAAKEAKAREKKEKEEAKAREKQQKADAKAKKEAEKARSAAEPKAAATPAATPAVTPAARPAAHAAEKPASAAKEPRASGEKADPAKGPPTARCKDGSLSYSEHHSGACSNHGGVEEWLDKK